MAAVNPEIVGSGARRLRRFNLTTRRRSGNSGVFPVQKPKRSSVEWHLDWERRRPRRRVGRKLWKSAGETPALPGGTRLSKHHSSQGTQGGPERQAAPNGRTDFRRISAPPGIQVASG